MILIKGIQCWKMNIHVQIGHPKVAILIFLAKLNLFFKGSSSKLDPCSSWSAVGVAVQVPYGSHWGPVRKLQKDSLPGLLPMTYVGGLENCCIQHFNWWVFSSPGQIMIKLVNILLGQDLRVQRKKYNFNKWKIHVHRQRKSIKAK